jgi:hypothetical protein
VVGGVRRVARGMWGIAEGTGILPMAWVSRHLIRCPVARTLDYGTLLGRERVRDAGGTGSGTIPGSYNVHGQLVRLPQ